MVLVFLAKLFKTNRRFVWTPAITIRDGATAAALGIYGPR